MNLYLFLGDAVSPKELYPKDTILNAGAREYLTVICAACGVGLLLLVWAFFYMKRRRGHHHHSHGHHHASSVGSEALDAVERGSANGEVRHRHRRRKRRREHRPRNPTLAETGGLPPVRREDEPPRF